MVDFTFGRVSWGLACGAAYVCSVTLIGSMLLVLSVEMSLETERNHTVRSVFDHCVFGGHVVVKEKCKRKQVRGSLTVEAAVIVPFIMLVFATLLYIMFYYHDKNILTAVAHETVSIGCGREEKEAEELERSFYTRTSGKLLLFTWVSCDVQTEEQKVSLTCSAKKSAMSLQVDCTMNKTDPEQQIRDIRKIKKIGEGIGELH